MQPQETIRTSISTQIDAIIGVDEKERISPQPLNIHIISFSKINVTKELLEVMRCQILEYCLKNRPKLLEKMAYDLSELLSAKNPYLCDLEITIEKPEALKEALCSYVVIRTRGLN